MAELSYIKMFIEIYNVGAAFIIIFLILQILLILRRVDRDLLKARVFLNEEVLQRTWLFISIAGASYAIHSLGNFVSLLLDTTGYYFFAVTQLIFLAAFISAVYNWYVFIDGIKNKKII